MAVWNESVPTNDDLAHTVDDTIRGLKLAVRERLDREHLWSSSQTGSDEAGAHRFVTLKEQTGAPSLVVGTNTQQGALYISTTGDLLMVSSNSALHNLVPVGVCLPFFGTSSPDGWLICNGTEVSRTTYARLFSVIGTAAGTGNGTTTFNIPEMRGRGFMGVDNMGGVAANVVTASAADIVCATYGSEVYNMEHTHTLGVGITIIGTTGGSYSTVTSTAGSGVQNVINPVTFCNAIIKF